MRLKRFLGLVLAVALFVSLSSMGTASAQDISHSKSYLVVKATGRFSMEVPGNTAVQAGSSFPLEVGDVVVIMTTYSPFSASVDFGLIAPDGLFYGSNTSTGTLQKGIAVDQRGYYTLAVRNRSDHTVSVCGYANHLIPV